MVQPTARKPYLVRDTAVRGLMLAINRQSETWTCRESELACQALGC